MDGVHGAAGLEKGLALLSLIARDNGETKLSVLAKRLLLPPSTGRRLAAALERHGLVARAGHGYYMTGRALMEMGTTVDHRELLIRISRPQLRRLARALKATTHLGILEADMVTYAVKEQWGAKAIFSREGEQLEAYCSAIGKVLLAHLDAETRQAYVTAEIFVPLTEHTIVDPGLLSEELEAVRGRGYATDMGEVANDIYCVAVPLMKPEGRAIAAISVSFRTPLGKKRVADLVPQLAQCAANIGKSL